MLSSVPAFVQAQYDQGNVSQADYDLITDSGFLKVTLYDGWNGVHHVDGNPDTLDPGDSQLWEDSTKALQKAIDDAYAHGLVAFFPAGNYQITDTLGAFQWGKLNGAPDEKSNVLVGESMETTTITLGESANGKFDVLDSEGNPRPMLMFRHMVHPTQTNFERVPISHPQADQLYPGEDWVNTPYVPGTGNQQSFQSRANVMFHNEVRDLSFDLGGYNGAAGLYMPGAQNSSVHNVSFDATGAHAGVWNLPGRNGGAANITVEGGKYGIMLVDGGLGNQNPNHEAMFQPIVAGAKLYNQTIAAFRSTEQNPVVLVGFHITRDTPGPVITIPNLAYATSPGSLTLVDGIIEVSGGGVALQNASGKNLYVRNVYVSGTDSLVKGGNQPIVTGSGAWKRIAEYAYTDHNSPPAGDPPYEQNDDVFRSFNIIDGTISQSPEPSTVIEHDVAPPPADFLEQHIWESLPSYFDEESDVVVVTDPVHGATPGSGIDNQNAIQSAIDAASSAGHGRVFIPPGKYEIGGTLTLHANTVLFGAGRHLSWIKWHDSWRPTEGNPAMIETVDDPDATTFLGFLSIEVRTRGSVGNNNGVSNDHIADDYDRFAALHWRAGRNSMTVATEILKQFKGTGANKEQATQPHSVIRFSGGGGGRHFFMFPPDKDYADHEADFRKLLIEETTEPLWFYGMNLEHSESDAEAEVRGAQNVRFYGMKTEGGGLYNTHTNGWGMIPTLLIRDSLDANSPTPSQNIAVYGSGGIRQKISNNPATPGAFVVLGNSEDILIANAVPHKADNPPNGAPLLYEKLDGKSAVEIDWPDALNLYKRGEIDDSVMIVDRSTGPDVLLELEKLTPVDRSGNWLVNTSHPNASGEAFANYGSESVGDYVTYEVDVPAAGDYDLVLGLGLGPAAGILRLSVDGQTVGPDQDLNGGYLFENRSQGTVSFATPGTKQFRFEVVGSTSGGYGMRLDSLSLFAPRDIDQQYEFKEADVQDSSGEWAVDAFHANASGGQNGGEYVSFGSNEIDDYIEFGVDITAVGTYDVGLRVGKSPNSGKVQMSIDGQAVGQDLDLYDSDYPFETLSVGQVTFDRLGSHAVRFDVVGTSGNDYRMRLDTLVLTVTNTNRAPVLAAISNQSVSENGLLTVNLSATDADGDALTLSASGLPPFATLTDNGDGTGTIAFAPGFADAGSYPITVTATDANNAADSDTFTLNVAELYEFESLIISDYSAGDWFDDDATHGNASNGEYVNFGSDEIGDYIEFTVDVTTAGSYDLTLGVGLTPKSGILRVSVDGQVVGADQDLFDPLLYTFEERDLGSVTFDTPGAKLVRFDVVGSSGTDYRARLDSLSLTASQDVDQFFDLRREQATAHTGGWLTDTFNGAAYDDEFVNHGSSGVGQYVEFELDVTSVGVYEVELVAGLSMKSGKVRLSIDGQTVGADQDLYDMNYVFAPRSFGLTTFNTLGPKSFRFEVVGQNSASTGFHTRLDTLSLNAVNALPAGQMAALRVGPAVAETSEDADAPTQGWRTQGVDPVNQAEANVRDRTPGYDVRSRGRPVFKEIGMRTLLMKRAMEEEEEEHDASAEGWMSDRALAGERRLAARDLFFDQLGREFEDRAGRRPR